MKSKKSPTDFSKTNIFAQIMLLALLMGAIYLFKPSTNLFNNGTPDLATLIINFETLKKSFEGEVIEDMTMLDALNAAVSVGKLKFTYAIDESGNVSVMEIYGYINGVNNKYLAFYLNSQKVAAEDLNKEIIHGGDRIEIRNE